MTPGKEIPIHFHEIKQDVLLRIEKIIADNGAEIAFPTSTIHLESGEPGVRPEPAG